MLFVFVFLSSCFYIGQSRGVDLKGFVICEFMMSLLRPF